MPLAVVEPLQRWRQRGLVLVAVPVPVRTLRRWSHRHAGQIAAAAGTDEQNAARLAVAHVVRPDEVAWVLQVVKVFETRCCNAHASLSLQ